MKKQRIVFILLFFLINTTLIAKERFIYGTVSHYGENNELIHDANVAISIIRPANLNSSDISTSLGRFKLGIGQLASGTLLELMAKKQGKQSWAMLHPYQGKVRVPKQAENDLIHVILVPVDSYKRKSVAEMTLIIQQAAAQQAMQAVKKSRNKVQGWQQQLAQLADKKGIPKQQFIDDINAFIEAVANHPNDYTKETQAHADYAKKKFKLAEKSFVALAEQHTKKSSQLYKMAGLSAYEAYRYQQAIEYYKKALAHTNKQQYPQDWAELQKLLGNAHQLFASQTSSKAITQHFSLANKAYQQALTVYTRKQLPQQWATIQSNIALVLQAQGIRTEGKQAQRLFAKAVKTYHLALEVETREQVPLQWAITQNNLAVALLAQGNRIGGKQGQTLLDKAVMAYRLALEIYTRKQSPQDWAMIQNNLAMALKDQSIRTEGKRGNMLLDEAVTTYRLILEVYTRKQFPQDWAMTQNNLANALVAQGTRIGGKQGKILLIEAEMAYRLALEVYTRKQLPQQWAFMQNNLAIALEEQGTRIRGKQGEILLAEAVTAYRLALEVYTRKQLPQQWAATQNNLANALRDQGIRTKGKQGLDLLAKSVQHLRFALEVRTPKYLPAAWQQSHNNLAKALSELGYRLLDEPSRLKKAREVLAEAVTITPKQSTYQYGLAWAEYRLGHLKQAESLLQQIFDDYPYSEIACRVIEDLWKNAKQDLKQSCKLECRSDFTDVTQLGKKLSYFFPSSDVLTRQRQNSHSNRPLADKIE